MAGWRPWRRVVLAGLFAVLGIFGAGQASDALPLAAGTGVMCRGPSAQTAATAGRRSAEITAQCLTVAQDGQFGGDNDAIAVQGHYAYMGAGPNLKILDISNPAQPALVGETGTLSGIVRDVAVTGNYAYVSLKTGLYGVGGLGIVDVSNPARPSQVGFSDFPNQFPNRIVIAGNYVYVGAANDIVYAVNVADPRNPSVATDVATLANYPQGLAFNGEYLYSTDSEPHLYSTQVLIAPPYPYPQAGPDHSVPALGVTQAVVVANGKAYVAEGAERYSDFQGIQIFDLTDPQSPKSIGSLALPGIPVDLALTGSDLYVAASDGGLQVVNVADPTHPSLAGSLSLPDAAQRVVVAGSDAYVAGALGLHIVNISNPAKLSAISFYGATPSNPYVVDVVGNTAYVADYNSGLHILDVANLAQPVDLGYVYSPGAINLAVSGTHAFVAEGTSGLDIFDVSKPSSPAEVGSINPAGGNVYDVAASGNYAYLADGSAGLVVVDASDPAAPRVIGKLALPASAQAVAVSGSLVYVGTATTGTGASPFLIVDVSNPASPTVLGQASTYLYATDVVVQGTRAYVEDPREFSVFDVSNPRNPTLLGRGGTGVYGVYGGTGIAVLGNDAYVIDENHGLTICDITDPTNPQTLETYVLPGYGQGIAAANGALYVADGDGGLFFLQNFGSNPKHVVLPFVANGA